MIVNRTYVLDRSATDTPADLLAAVERGFTAEPLRWFISSADDRRIIVEATEYEGKPPVEREAVAPGSSRVDVVLSLIPTGVGCEVGGYAGDAGPATALLAASADLVVTNPNAVNASNFINIDDRVLYTEGYFIDQFSRGQVALARPRANRIGVIVERAAADRIDAVVNIVNTARAVHGVDVVDILVTDTPIGTRCVRNASGAYVGTVDEPEVLLDAARRLIERGASAIAVTTQVQDLPSVDYASHFRGEHPNPVGGAEAVVSHLIGRTFQVPVAHAPMVNFTDPAVRGVVDARGAGEFASYSGLACVLIGLRGAPHVARFPGCGVGTGVRFSDVVAVVAPAGALGGVPVLRAAEQRIPIIAVRDNGTILNVSAAALGLPGVIEVSNYAEAAGIVLALRSGISLDSIARPLTTLRPAMPAVGVSAGSGAPVTA